MNVLTVNLVASTLVFWIAARLYLLPRLAMLPAALVIGPMLLLHAMRHLGLMFLAPGATYPGVPPEFAYPAALGDTLAAILALVALAALVRNARATRPLLWLFSVVGVVDLVAAIALATAYEANATMGPAYWIPAFWVPALLVTHAIILGLLTGRLKAGTGIVMRTA